MRSCLFPFSTYFFFIFLIFTARLINNREMVVQLFWKSQSLGGGEKLV